MASQTIAALPNMRADDTLVSYIFQALETTLLFRLMHHIFAAHILWERSYTWFGNGLNTTSHGFGMELALRKGCWIFAQEISVCESLLLAPWLQAPMTIMLCFMQIWKLLECQGHVSIHILDKNLLHFVQLTYPLSVYTQTPPRDPTLSYPHKDAFPILRQVMHAVVLSPSQIWCWYLYAPEIWWTPVPR